MGRHKTPTSVLEQRGSWRAKLPNRQNEIEVPALPKPPKPPAWLKTTAKPHWVRISKMLHARGLLAEIDTMALGLLCDRLADYLDLRERIEQDGWTTYNAEGGEATHPNVRAHSMAIKDVIQLAKLFGMTPTERAGLVVEKPNTGNVLDGKTKFRKG
jgi:P27 family predicted phage terminase small subunit